MRTNRNGLVLGSSISLEPFEGYVNPNGTRRKRNSTSSIGYETKVCKRWIRRIVYQTARSRNKGERSKPRREDSRIKGVLVHRKGVRVELGTELRDDRPILAQNGDILEERRPPKAASAEIHPH
jgi:hypothetical protein